MIVRNDDFSSASDLFEVLDAYDAIKKVIPEVEIWTAITVFGKGNNLNRALYPDLPLKDKDNTYLYDVDRITSRKHVKFISCFSKVVSHGLFHVDHTKLDYDAMKMSILSSCSYLNTSIFVPPFGKANKTMYDLCVLNGITLEHYDLNDNWKSFEFSKFTPEHKNWYFHSWRVNADKIRDILNG